MTDLAIFAATSGHSGVDRVLRNLVPAMAARGMTIDVLGIERHGPHWQELPSGVHRVALQARHVNGAIPALIRYLKKTNPTALLTDKDRVNRAAIIARQLSRTDTRLGVRLGTTVSVNLASRRPFDRWLQSQSMRWLYPHTDAVLVPSAGAADDLAEYARLTRSRIRVVPSPVITDDMQNRAEETPDHRWFRDGGDPIILGVGELSARKDFSTLVKAHAALQDDYPCRLLILGEGRRRRELEELATGLGTRDRLDLPGFVANPYPYMKRAAIFALSSRWEGMPVVLIEALALGTPVVACDCPSGPRELLQGGALGPLVPVGDHSAFARALKQTLAHPLPSEQLIAGVQRYTADNSARAYLEALGFPISGEVRG